MPLQHIKSPDDTEWEEGRFKIFLGGSIEMGKAAMWQDDLVRYLSKRPYADKLDVYNPRRTDWDSSWDNDYNCPSFKQQVDWELQHQKTADLLVYYFAADTISPISLFELGLFHQKKPVIGVDPAYSRIGNIMVAGDHFDMDVYDGWGNFCIAVENRLNEQF